MSLPIVALGQQKLRTTLTTVGVIFGAFVLAASLSIGQGVQETIDRESRRQDIARRVEIDPRWNTGPDPADLEAVSVEGTFDDARRERIRQSLAEIRVTTLAAVYPARHAAQIDPVSALRHE